MYYSSDDTVGTRKLSPITVYPSEDVNTSWRIGRGRTDIAPGLEDAYYRFPFHIGPLIRQDAWIGLEWAPNFDPTAGGPPQNPVLIRAISTGATMAFKPMIFYDVGAGEFILQFDNGDGDTRTYTAPMTQISPRVSRCAWWPDGPTTRPWFISRWTIAGARRSALLEQDDHPARVDQPRWPGGALEFQGIFTAASSSWTTGSQRAFHANPVYYTNPDPVIPDAQGRIPATSLDNAIYTRSSIAQEHGTGGGSATHFEDKEWTPIWRDYIVTQGHDCSSRRLCR